MKIYIGSDHAAFIEKEEVKAFLASFYDLEDCGTFSGDRCDYPDFASTVAKSVRDNSDSLGVLLCGSGIGVSMVANRYSGIRAALCRTEEDAKLSREHNNSNIICVGARLTSMDDIKSILKTWLSTDFEGGRHEGRIEKFNGLGES